MYALTNGSCCCTTSLSQSAQVLLILLDVGQCKCRQSVGVHATNNRFILWQILHSILQCRFLDMHIIFKSLVIHGRCYVFVVDVPSISAQTLTNGACHWPTLMLLNRCTQATGYAYIHCMIYIVCLRLIEAHKPLQMPEDLCFCYLQLETLHVHYMEATTDVT